MLTASTRDAREFLLNLAKRGRNAVARGSFRQMNIEMTEMKKRVPVMFGVLRDSGQVDDPRWVGDHCITDLGFGGAAAEYAEKVHEDLEAYHDTGQAKYAESVLNESAIYLPGRVAADVQADLGLR